MADSNKSICSRLDEQGSLEHAAHDWSCALKTYAWIASWEPCSFAWRVSSRFTCEGFLLMENEDTFDGLLETIEKRKDSVLLRVIFNEGLQKSSLITSLQSANSSLQTRFQKGLKLAALCERARDSSPAECIACIQEALALNITIEDKGCMTGPHDFTCFVQC